MDRPDPGEPAGPPAPGRGVVAGSAPDPAERPSRGRRRSRGAAVDVTVLLAVSFVAPLVLTWSSGALGLPHNDDWAYARVLFDWTSTGHLRLIDFSEQTLIGQLLLAWPLSSITGARLAPVQVEMAVLNAGGVVATYLLGRSSARRPLALVAALCVAAGPLFGPLTVSFMGDLPALALSLLCLLAGSHALRSEGRRRAVWLVAATLVGFAAFSIRQTAAAAPLAVLVVAWWSSSSRRRRRRTDVGSPPDGRVTPILLGAVLVAAALLVLSWRAGLPNSGMRGLAPSPDTVRSAVQPALAAAFVLGLLVVPMLVALGPVRLLRNSLERHRRTSVVLMGAAVLGAVAVVATGGMDADRSFAYVNRFGPMAYSAVVMGTPRPVVPVAVWWAVELLAVAATVVAAACLPLVWRAVRGAPRRVDAQGPRGDDVGDEAGPEPRPATTLNRLLLVYLVAYVGLVAAGIVIGRSPFDRYLVPAVPAVALLLAGVDDQLRPPRRSVGVPAVVVTTLFVLAGMLWTVVARSFDAQRWELATQLQEGGVPATNIDAGMQWLGYASRAPVAVGSSANRTWYAQLFADVDACYLVVQGDDVPSGLTDADLVRRSQHTAAGVTRTWSVYRAPACADRGSSSSDVVGADPP